MNDITAGLLISVTFISLIILAFIIFSKNDNLLTFKKIDFKFNFNYGKGLYKFKNVSSGKETKRLIINKVGNDYLNFHDSDGNKFQFISGQDNYMILENNDLYFIKSSNEHFVGVENNNYIVIKETDAMSMESEFEKCKFTI